MPVVSFAARTLPHYRVAFFTDLRNRLAADGVELRVVYGDQAPDETSRRDAAELEWAEYRPNRFLRVGDRFLIWQPVLDLPRQSDLVIVEQAARLVANYPLLLAQLFGQTRVAFWGHGENLQHDSSNRLVEAIKRPISRMPAWWFAYTEGARVRVASLGFPDCRITVVNNASDTSDLRLRLEDLTVEQVEAWRERHELGRGPIALFLGSIYRDKRIAFALEAAARARRQITDLQVVIAGGGPDLRLVEHFAAKNHWVRAIGPVFGHEKALALTVADLVTVPDAVGLVALDAFTAGRVLVTTAGRGHGPEFEYLASRKNSLVTGPAMDVDAYATAIVELLRDKTARRRLEKGARAAASEHTLEEMVRRFAAGIRCALSAARST